MQEQRSEKPDLLEEVDAFTGGMATAISTLMEVPKGKMLLTEGKVARHVYFVQSGLLRAYYARNGKELNVNFFFEGEFVTNLKSYHTRTPSEYNISASEPTIVRVFEKDQLCDWSRRSVNFESWMRCLYQRLLIRQEEHGNLFKIYTPSERYHYIAKHYPKILQRVPLSQISSYLGISRETISRIRRNAPMFIES